jgi:hypothetical protein
MRLLEGEALAREATRRRVEADEKCSAKEEALKKLSEQLQVRDDISEMISLR